MVVLYEPVSVTFSHQEIKLFSVYFICTVNPFYTDTRYNDWHDTFAQEMTVNQKFCKNLYLILPEAILTNIKKHMF